MSIIILLLSVNIVLLATVFSTLLSLKLHRRRKLQAVLFAETNHSVA